MCLDMVSVYRYVAEYHVWYGACNGTCHVTGTAGDDIPLCGYHDRDDVYSVYCSMYSSYVCYASATK